MLEATGIHARHGRIPVLNGVSLNVAAGEAVGILGHNGVGKTTLLRTLMGHLPLTAGTLTFEGRDIARLPIFRRARMGLTLVPQGREIFPFLSVEENLRLAARDPDALPEMLEEFPTLKGLLARQGGSLSGGQQQILAIARCLCARPRCILLDEPTEGIQPSIVDEIGLLLTRLRDKRGLALVIVEQRLEFLAGLVDRALVMQKGLIVRELPAAMLHDEAAVEAILGLG